MVVVGAGIRNIDPRGWIRRVAYYNVQKPVYFPAGMRWSLAFQYNEFTGEPIQQPPEIDDDSEENADSDSDGGGSLGSEFLNADGELAGFRD